MQKLLFVICATFLLTALTLTAQAGGCLQNSSLSGTCTKGTACPSGSVSSNDLQSVTQTTQSIDFFAGGCQQDELCCIKKGSDVCNKVTQIFDAVNFKDKKAYDECIKAGSKADFCAKEFKPVSAEANCTPSGQCPSESLITGAMCPDGYSCCGVKIESKSPEVKANLGSTTKLEDPLSGATVFTLINRLVNAILGVVGALALLVFVYAGITWMTAGSSNRVQEAKDAMKYAVIGLALIALAYMITTNFIVILTGG